MGYYFCYLRFFLLLLMNCWLTVINDFLEKVVTETHIISKMASWVKGAPVACWDKNLLNEHKFNSVLPQ